jgi:hypothetical protein
MEDRVSMVLPDKTSRPAGALTWITAVGFAAVGAALCYMLAYAIIVGAEIRARADQQQARDIVREDTAFCAKFGMRPGTSGFATCRDGLMQVRQRQAERVREEAKPW